MNARARRWLLGTAAAIALGLVALSYLQPALMVQLSEQIWACF